MLMQNVFFLGEGGGGGTKRCIMGDVQAANGNYYYYSSLILRKTASLERAIVAKTNWKGKEKKKNKVINSGRSWFESLNSGTHFFIVRFLF